MTEGAPTQPTSGPSPVVAQATASAHRWRPASAAAGWTAAVVLSLVGFLLWVRSGYAPLPQGFMSPIGFLALISLIVTQATAGLILAVRRPDNPIGLIIISFALAVSLASFANGYVALADTGAELPLDPAWVAALTLAIAFSMGTLVALILGMVFPDGRLLSPGWRLVLAMSAIGAIAMGLGMILTPGPLLLVPGTDAPIRSGQVPSWIGITRDVIGPLFLALGSIASGCALVVRYRQADELGRLQLRWYLASGVVLSIGFIAYVLAIYVPADEQLGKVVLTLFYLSASIPPVAMVFAILRYNLYGIDTILGRTFVYGALTAILAGLYTASVRLFNALFVGVAGQSSELVLVITTLILATTFTPIKRRLEAVVEHRMKPVAAVAGGGSQDQPIVDGSAVFSDPAFGAALRAQIRAVLAEGTGSSGRDHSGERDPGPRPKPGEAGSATSRPERGV